jgi:probable AcnD-accessory protein PrpF
MDYFPAISIAATYMRGGTSKGVFFKLTDLPKNAQIPGKERDQILLRVIGSPDPYKKQTDGMGGATSSTSKVVIISKSAQKNHDIDYLFGQVSIEKPLINWSGNCGNLSAAVGAFAIDHGLISKEQIPKNGTVKIRIWQKNIQKTIVAHIPIINNAVQEMGDFFLDGVVRSAAKIHLEFIAPTKGKLFPTGKMIECLKVPNIGDFQVTLIDSGIPTVFIDAKDLGYNGTELQNDINHNLEALMRLEKIRAYAAMKMGLIKDIKEASTQQHIPKIAWVAPARDYFSSNGKPIKASDIALNVRALSMGLLHHAMMGTAAIAVATASVIPGTLLHRLLHSKKSLPKHFSLPNKSITFGHPSGVLTVGADVVYSKTKEEWVVNHVSMERSARCLMKGNVFIHPL